MRFIQLLAVSTVALAPHLALGQKADITQQGLQAPPLMMLEDAKSQFHGGNLDEAVKDLRSASTLIRIEATTYIESERATVEGFAADFERVAQEVKSGTLKTAKKFDQSVAEVTAAKAAFHVAQAKKVWLAKDTKRAGYELLAAAHAVEHSAVWSGAKISQATQQAIAAAKEAGNKMIEGKDWAASEAEKVMQTLEKDAEKLLKDTKTDKSTH